MMKKGIILSFISQFLISSCLMPFFFSSDVYADTLPTSDIVGTVCTYTAVDSELYSGTSGGLLQYLNTGTVHVTWKLKKSYIGRVRINIDLEVYSYVNNSPSYLSISEPVYAFLNGDTFEYEFNVNSFGNKPYQWINIDDNNSTVDNPLRGWSIAIVNSNVTSYDSLVDLQGIIDLLTDIYADTTNLVGLSTNQLSTLQSILQECQAQGITLTDIDNQLIDVNSELDIISDLRQYNIPFESFSFVSQIFNRGFSTYDVYQNRYIGTFPIFTVPVDSLFYSISLSGNSSHPLNSATFVVGSTSNINNVGFVASMFGIDTTKFSVSNFTYINYIGNYYFVKFDVSNISGTNMNLDLYNKYTRDIRLVPVFVSWTSRNQYVSTEFALKFGLTNQLLDDIHLIAQGTQQSNTSADNLEDNNDQMSSDMDSLATIENGYNQDFNNQLQNIDFSNPIQQNSGILPAANFVISVFNGLINNNPFSTLIIIVCILLIGKKVIGK